MDLNKGYGMSYPNLAMTGTALCLSGLIVIGIAGHADCQVGATATPAQTVRGDVLNIEDEFYIVKDISGHEMRIHVDKDTKMEDRIKVGDKIEAQINSNAHASAMKVQIPDTGVSKPASPGVMP
jgi:hypothetical protein